MKDVFQNIYNGLLRFSPLRKYFRFKSSRKGNFPSVGFLDNEKKAELEKNLGVVIINTEYFEQALLHRSYLQVLDGSHYLSNERLEFLGDAILGMVVGEYLFSLHTSVLEGELTKMRSWLVNKNSLALCAKKINLDSFLMLSYSAEKSLENGSDSILADALEAIIAAVYLDAGIEQARKFIINSLLPIMINKSVMVDKNYKSILLESVQAEGMHSPRYNVIEEKGPDHDKEFTVGVYVENELKGQGEGRSKKEAEQKAAKDALKKMNLLQDNY